MAEVVALPGSAQEIGDACGRQEGSKEPHTPKHLHRCVQSDAIAAIDHASRLPSCCLTLGLVQLSGLHRHRCPYDRFRLRVAIRDSTTGLPCSIPCKTREGSIPLNDKRMAQCTGASSAICMRASQFRPAP